MTQNISSLQSELLKLFNPVYPSSQSNESISTDNELTTDDIINASTKIKSDDLTVTGGQNIGEMVENILSGGSKKQTKPEEPNNTSPKEIIDNILNNANENEESTTETDNEDSATTEITNTKPEEIIKDIMNNNKTNEEEEQTEPQEQPQLINSDVNNDNNNSSSASNSDDNSENDDNSSSSSDDSFEGPDEYLSIINEFNSANPPTTHLTGGSTTTAHRVKIIPYFPYILKG